METTTVQIRKTLRAKLEKMRAYPKESLDSVIGRLVEACTDKEPLSEEEIKGIEEGLADIRAGRVYTTKELKKGLGIR